MESKKTCDSSPARGLITKAPENVSRESPCKWELPKGEISAQGNSGVPREALTAKWWYEAAKPDSTPLIASRAERERVKSSAENEADKKDKESSDVREGVRVPTAKETESENESARGAKRKCVAGMIGENRNFITIKLGGISYKALFDPGASLSLVGPKIAERFEHRMQKSDTCIKNVNGGVTRTLGTIKVVFEVEGMTESIEFKAVHNLDQEIILGMDFCRKFDCDTRLGRGLWRLREGEWRPFADGNSDGGALIHAECAGISQLDECE